MEGGRPRPRLTPGQACPAVATISLPHTPCMRAKVFLANGSGNFPVQCSFKAPGKYNGTYMGQITIYLDDETERLVKRHAKASGKSASKWIAEAVCKRASDEWPADILSLFGTWKDEDLPDVSSLRTGYGNDLPREEF